jgi:predicted homoserine dehydrogenase-like protein
LKKELQDNWWKAELNGEKIRIRITAVEPSRGLKKRMSGMRGIVGNMMDLSRVSHFL